MFASVPVPFRMSCAPIVALAFSVTALATNAALADDMTQQAPAASRGSFTVVGKIVAVEPGSATIVIDVPQAQGILRVGASVPATAAFLVGTRRLSLQDLRPGQRVRLLLRRVPTGDQVISGELIRTPHQQPGA